MKNIESTQVAAVFLGSIGHSPAQQRSGQRALNIVLISIAGLILDIFVIQPTAEPINRSWPE